jgi:hypothetical protein
MTLDDIVKKLRKVKYGDYVLADDHNDLVDSVISISKHMRFGNFSNDIEYSVYNEGKFDWYTVILSLYSKKLGKIDGYYLNYTFSMYARLWSSVDGLSSQLILAFHTKDHPAGEVQAGDSYVLTSMPDYLYNHSVYNRTTTPTIKFNGSNISQAFFFDYVPKDIYVVIWLGCSAGSPPKAYTAYVDKIRVYWNVFGLWE